MQAKNVKFWVNGSPYKVVGGLSSLLKATDEASASLEKLGVRVNITAKLIGNFKPLADHIHNALELQKLGRGRIF